MSEWKWSWRGRQGRGGFSTRVSGPRHLQQICQRTRHLLVVFLIVKQKRLGSFQTSQQGGKCCYSQHVLKEKNCKNCRRMKDQWQTKTQTQKIEGKGVSVSVTKKTSRIKLDSWWEHHVNKKHQAPKTKILIDAQSSVLVCYVATVLLWKVLFSLALDLSSTATSLRKSHRNTSVRNASEVT